MAAHELVARLLERDDVGSLPIPGIAKAYARRAGLKSMLRQPKDFQKVNAQLLNPGKQDKFHNYDAGEQTGGRRVPAAPKE